MGHFYRTCVEGFVIRLEVVLKLVGNVLDIFWKFSGSNTSFVTYLFIWV